MLGDQWRTAVNIDKLLLSMYSFLLDPNPKDIYRLYCTNRIAYNKKAREWIRCMPWAEVNDLIDSILIDKRLISLVIYV